MSFLKKLKKADIGVRENFPEFPDFAFINAGQHHIVLPELNIGGSETNFQFAEALTLSSLELNKPNKLINNYLLGNKIFNILLPEFRMR